MWSDERVRIVIEAGMTLPQGRRARRELLSTLCLKLRDVIHEADGDVLDVNAGAM